MDAERQKIKTACLRLLNRREHSQHELLTKVSLKGFNRTDIQCILDELAQEGWQSDARFAQSYAQSRLNSGFGELKIQYELKQRGIKEFDLNSWVENELGGWENLLEQVYQQKYADDVEITAKEYLKRSHFLQQRGFSSNRIQKLFRHLKLRNTNDYDG